MKKIFAFFVFATALMSCGEEAANKQPKEKSETLKEAEVYHEKTIQLYNETVEKLHATIEGHEKRIEMYGDDPEREETVKALAARLTKLEALHDDIHEFEHNIVEIPGHAHSHDHDHGHDHAHDHKHDHAQDRVLEGLSDEEHLEIQRELYEEMTKLSKRYAVIANS